MSSWEESVSWTREAVLERESAPELVCKVFESERASEKGGTEGVASALEGKANRLLDSATQEDFR